MIPSDHEHVGAEVRETVRSALFSATRQLYGSDVRQAISRALGTVAQSVQADAAWLFRFTPGADGKRGVRRCIEWRAGSAAPSAEAAFLDGVAACGYTALQQGRPQCKRADQYAHTEGPRRWVQSIEATMLCPIIAEGRVWGGVQFVQQLSSGMEWSEHEARLLQPFAEHLAALLKARGAEAITGPRRPPEEFEVETLEGGLHAVDPQAIRLQRRVRAERALVEASKLLVSTDPFEMEELLAIVGEATGADYAYLVTIRPEEGDGPPPLTPESETNRPPIDLDAYAHYEWSAGTPTESPGRRMASGDEGLPPDGATFAVPILSLQNQLFGYLGIDFESESSPLEDEDVRVLNVLGDMLCTYLQRQITDRALRKSEQRYRHFVSTISEAIWRIDFDPPVAIDRAPDALMEALLEHGAMAECNGELARLFGAERPEELIGWSVGRLVEVTGKRLLRDVIDADFRLKNREQVVYDANREPRHFLVNTSGVIEDGCLISVWGSTTEVTERVQLERRMVTALEQQQQHIGRDLHDSVGQLLTGVRMLAQNLEERYFEAGAEGSEQVHKIISYAEEAAKHVSDLQRGLMPVQMERGGLAQALQELASNTDVLPEVDCIYVVDGRTDVRDHEKKLQLYRIAQEATNNALKHAHPSYIKIALKTDGEMIILEVEDDGMGFDVTQADKDSLGLHSMYYRARSINAKLRVHSEPGDGTTIRCELARGDVWNGEGERSA